METIQAIMTRRSVRKFKKDQIPDDILESMLQSARFAPSWANTQCWRFIIIKEDETKNKLSEAFPPRNPGLPSLLMAPLVIVAFAEKYKSGYYKGEASTDKGEYWYMFDTALALQNMVLTAWDRGIGSVYLGLFDAKKVKEILEIPENYDVVAIVPFGYPDEEPKCPPRKDLKEIVHHEKFRKLDE